MRYGNCTPYDIEHYQNILNKSKCEIADIPQQANEYDSGQFGRGFLKDINEQNLINFNQEKFKELRQYLKYIDC